MRRNLPDNKIAFEIHDEVAKVIKGLDNVLRLVTVAIFSHGHILLEGVPGVAKTTLLRAFSQTIGGGFARISGTPDKLPMDFLYEAWPIIQTGENGSINPQCQTTQTGSLGMFRFCLGPLLKHGENLAVLLIDEVNRLMARTQAAFLEMMQERAITCGSDYHRVPQFIVVATRNPLETEETSELPEAQRDRFMFEGQVPLPSLEVMEELISNPIYQDTNELLKSVKQIIKLDELGEIRKAIQNNVRVSAEMKNYGARLCEASRCPEKYAEIPGMEKEELSAIVRTGLSPRAPIFLGQAGRALAWMDGRDYLLPSDIQEIFFDVCCHRYFLSRIHLKRRSGLSREILGQILEKISAPKGGW